MKIEEAYAAWEQSIKERGKTYDAAEQLKILADSRREASRNAIAQVFYDEGLFKGEWDLTDSDYNYDFELGKNIKIAEHLKEIWGKAFYVNSAKVRTSNGVMIEIACKSTFAMKPAWRIKKVYLTELPVFLQALENDGIKLKIKYYPRTIKILQQQAVAMQKVVDEWTLNKVSEL